MVRGNLDIGYVVGKLLSIVLQRCSGQLIPTSAVAMLLRRLVNQDGSERCSVNSGGGDALPSSLSQYQVAGERSFDGRGG